MATITTTIKEPKTFQQIQDQENELGKTEAMERLNENVAKLIQTINEKEKKKETEQDRQLKMNQLELSKLQLRRAQLGLAKDEKYYQDYSRKWNEKNNLGTSIGLSKNAGSGLGALGVSALTGGLINPVIVKQVLFPMFNPLVNATKAIASFPGLLPMLFRRVSGKTSSAVASDPDKRLHGKLDQILGAIKDKTKSSKAKEEKEQSMLSKLLNTVLLGALGFTALNTILDGETGVIGNTLKEHGKAMLAGFVLYGWKGALVGLALDVFAKETGIIPKETDKPTILDITAENAVSTIKQLLGKEGKNFPLTKEQFKLAMAGLMFAGPKGMLVGYLLGNKVVKNAINAFNTNGLSGLQDVVEDQIDKLKEGTILERIPSKAIEGAIVGASLGIKGGPKGFLIGALLGAAGGFVWDRYINANTPEEHGIHTQFNPEKFDWDIAGLDKTWTQFRKEAKEDLKKKKIKLTTKNIDRRTSELIRAQLEAEGKSNVAKGFSEVMFDYGKKKIAENPIETMAAAGGIALLTSGVAEGLLGGTIRKMGNAAKSLITTDGSGAKLASLVNGLVLLWIAKGLWDANGEVNKQYEEELFEEENRGKEASEILKGIKDKAIENGDISKTVMAWTQEQGAKIFEWLHPKNSKKASNYKIDSESNIKDFERYAKKYKEGELPSLLDSDWLDGNHTAKSAAINALNSLHYKNEALTQTTETKWFGEDIYELADTEIAEKVGFKKEEIKRLNELLKKEDITRDEALFLIYMAKKMNSYDLGSNSVKITNSGSQKETIVNNARQQQIDDAQEKAQQKEAEEDENLKNNTDKTEANTIALQALTDVIKKPIVNFDGTYQTPITPGETYRDSNGNIRYRTTG